MKILFSEAVRISRYLYCVEDVYNYLLKIDLESGMIREATRLTRKGKDTLRFYSGIKLRGNCLVAYPFSGDEVCLYSLNEKLCRWVDIKDMFAGSPTIITEYHQDEMSCYIYSTAQFDLFELDLLSGEKKLVSDCLDINNEYVGLLYNAALDDSIYFNTVMPSNILIEYDVHTQITYIHELECHNICHLCSAFGRIWLVTYEGDIIAWSKESGLKYIFKRVEHVGTYDMTCTKLIHDDSSIYMFGLYRDGSAIRIDPNTDTIGRAYFKNLFDKYDNEHETWLSRFYCFGNESNKGIYMQKKDRTYYYASDLSGHFNEPISIDLDVLNEKREEILYPENNYYDLNFIIELARFGKRH